MPLLPRQPVPALDGLLFALGVSPPLTFNLLVFYRGLHCPVCTKYLTELERLVPEFEQRGVRVIAISSDDEERARARRVRRASLTREKSAAATRHLMAKCAGSGALAGVRPERTLDGAIVSDRSRS
jgi:hypothetical protein